MKFKIYVFACFSIILGILLGISIFKKYDQNKVVISEGENIYFLQQGAYKNINNMNNNTSNITNFIYFKDENLYKVYVGITTSLENAKKLELLYNERGIEIYIKKEKVKDKSFFEKLKQYDNLLSKTNNESQIFNIVLQVLNEYKMVMESEY